MRLFLLAFLFGVTLLSFIVLVLLEHWSGQPGQQTTEQSFTVVRGENAWKVATRLEEARIVEHRFGFLYALAYLKKMSGLVAGEYRFSGALSPCEIAVRLSSGQTVSTDVRITFPEGFTAAQMADRLTENGLPGEEFLALVLSPRDSWRMEFRSLSVLPARASLEGFLFPDTYRFDRKADAETIIKLMLATFDRKVWPMITETKTMDVSMDPYRVLILASIVEMEVRSDADRRLVADLFLRRLSVNHPLESDATVQYILGLNKIQHSYEETRTESPYNTYIHKGLPPGPIANPGLSALQATLQPTSSAYFFFLSNPKTGETAFAKTYEEHLRNKSQHGL